MKLRRKERNRAESGQIMPLFALTSIVMLLIFFMIFDVGRVHLIQSKEQTASDAASLAGASQANAYEKLALHQEAGKVAVYAEKSVYHYHCTYNGADKKSCKRIPPYTRKIFDHWAYIKQPKQRKIVDKWAEIRPKDAKRAAHNLYLANAKHSILTGKGDQVRKVNPVLVGKDKMKVGTNVWNDYRHLPEFAQGNWGKDVPKSVTIHKDSEAKAKVIAW